MKSKLFLDEREITEKAVKVVHVLDGVPMSQIEPLLEEARDIVLASHVVRADSDRFSGILREFESATL